MQCRLVDTSLPESWTAFPELKEISLSGCNLRGTLPPVWGSMTQLQRLDLSDNPELTGALPPEWGSMMSLKSLDISLSQAPGLTQGLSGPLSESWADLLRLKYLDLRHQRISGMRLSKSWLYASLTLPLTVPR